MQSPLHTTSIHTGWSHICAHTQTHKYAELSVLKGNQHTQIIHAGTGLHRHTHTGCMQNSFRFKGNQHAQIIHAGAHRHKPVRMIRWARNRTYFTILNTVYTACIYSHVGMCVCYVIFCIDKELKPLRINHDRLIVWLFKSCTPASNFCSPRIKVWRARPAQSQKHHKKPFPVQKEARLL